MQCQHEMFPVSLTEEMILNYEALPKFMEGWARYRIEYGFECSCPEGLIYLPQSADRDRLEHVLNSMMRKKDAKR